jgi:hypothetical protein
LICNPALRLRPGIANPLYLFHGIINSAELGCSTFAMPDHR